MLLVVGRCYVAACHITHNSETAYKKDLARQARIESFGVSFLRFFDHDVRENLQGVVVRIRNWIEARDIPPAPLQRGETKTTASPLKNDCPHKTI
jgi:hypothetical protein